MSTVPLPSHEQAAKAVVPGVGALHDPATWLAAHFADEGRLAAASDMRSDPAQSKSGRDVRVVVALVEAQVLGSPRATWATHDDSVEHFADHAGIRHVRAGDERGEWHAATVGEDVPLYPAFRAVRRIWPREVPPFGAFTEALSNEVHFSAAPRRPW